MALHYKDIANHPKRLISFTGYKREEFERLCKTFEQQWNLYISHYTLEGKERDRNSNQRENNTFPLAEDKLLFILHYWKAYPLQEVMGVTIGIKQPQVNRWIKLLTPILKRSLKELKMLPERNAKLMSRKIGTEKGLILDGTEREIQRPSDYEEQKDYYSGKKRDTR